MTPCQILEVFMVDSSMTRKQQERFARDQLILSVANELFADQGYHQTSMQHIANKAGYSKGTIYQHYTCKEDVLAKLYLLCGAQLQSLIHSIVTSDSSLRLKIILIASVFLNNAKNLPAISSHVPLIKSVDFSSKLSEEHQQQITKLDGEILAVIIRLFDGCDNFDCDRVKHATFGWWSMQLGVQSVLTSGWDISAMGFNSPEECMFHSLNIFLNGLGIPDCDECQSWTDIEKESHIILKAVKSFI